MIGDVDDGMDDRVIWKISSMMLSMNTVSTSNTWKTGLKKESGAICLVKYCIDTDN